MNEDELTEEIFSVMGQLKQKMNEKIQSGNISETTQERVETSNFIGEFNDFAVSGNRTIADQMYVTRDGKVVLPPGIKFSIAIGPKNTAGSTPLRYEVDNQHRVGSGRIIHINDANNEFYPVPNEVIEAVGPNYGYDLVQISGNAISREAISKSLQSWNELNNE